MFALKKTPNSVSKMKFLLQVCGFDIGKYPNVTKWLAKCKSSVPSYAETNEEGVLKFKALFESRKK